MIPLIRAGTRNQLPGGRRGLLAAGLLVLLVGLVPAGEATAQMNHDQIVAYIEHTGELLQWGQEVIAETPSNAARRIFQQAGQLHQRSMDRMHGGRPLMAYELSRRARAAMWQAVGRAREAMSLEERIRIRSERLRELWIHLMDRAQEMGHEQAIDLLHQAERQGQRAREEYLQGNYEPAYRLYEQAEDLVQRAARLLVEAGGPGSLDRELERTQALIDRARERLAAEADPAAAKLLAEAEEALDRAVGHRDRGQPGRALQMASLARRLAARAATEAGGGASAETVQRQIDRFDARADRLGDRIGDSGDQRANDLYRRALDHRERAVQLLNDAHTDDALRQIKAAQDLLNQIDDLLH